METWLSGWRSSQYLIVNLNCMKIHEVLLASWNINVPQASPHLKCPGSTREEWCSAYSDNLEMEKKIQETHLPGQSISSGSASITVTLGSSEEEEGLKICTTSGNKGNWSEMRWQELASGLTWEEWQFERFKLLVPREGPTPYLTVTKRYLLLWYSCLGILHACCIVEDHTIMHHNASPVLNVLHVQQRMDQPHHFLLRKVNRRNCKA